MLEAPEIATIARQMREALAGRRVVSGTQGNTVHKFAWYSYPAEEYEAILATKTVGDATGDGKWLFCPLEPGYLLLLGDMGGRIVLHPDDSTLPQKHHLLLHFEDGVYLTVSIQMWAFLGLMRPEEVAQHKYASQRGISPLSDAFTYTYFQQLLADPEGGAKKSVKAFMISKPGVSGLGNGYLQDILFQARIHPKRPVAEMDDADRRMLYDATIDVLRRATGLGGMDTECDLYGQPGGYVRRLDKRAKDKPCPECGTPIEKIQYLGGACYFCPSCQT